MNALFGILFLLNFVIKISALIDEPVALWTEPYVWKFPGGTLDYLPLTENRALNKGWTMVSVPKIHSNLKVYCPYFDKTVCVMIDSIDRIVGVTIMILKNDTRTNNSPYKFNESPWFTEVEVNWKKYYLIKIFFVDHNHIKNPEYKQEIASFGNMIRIVGKNRTKLEVPPKEPELVKNFWEKQNCVQNRGTHYTYSNVNDTNCNNYLPVTILVKNKEIVGFAFIIPGSYHTGYMPYFEKTYSNILKERLPNMPNCLRNWKKYEYSSIYIDLVPLGYIKACGANDSVNSPSGLKKFMNSFTNLFKG